ncbi:unnamed protein product [Nippostrongylus brasiliensis]|uniref:Secreted protein n=1 Tax=Nippostrongylus brasiliensis TaxID=27835 RepID=A0A0N4YDN4_NIPBR|nr:unnamed protein product [Nippostrongylus brasiliensis]
MAQWGVASLQLLPALVGSIPAQVSYSRLNRLLLPNDNIDRAIAHVVKRLSSCCLRWCPCCYTEFDEPAAVVESSRPALDVVVHQNPRRLIQKATTGAPPITKEMTTTTMLTSLDVITPPNGAFWTFFSFHH